MAFRLATMYTHHTEHSFWVIKLSMRMLWRRKIWLLTKQSKGRFWWKIPSLTIELQTAEQTEQTKSKLSKRRLWRWTEVEWLGCQKPIFWEISFDLDWCLLLICEHCLSFLLLRAKFRNKSRCIYKKLLSSKTFNAGKDITFRDKHKTHVTNEKVLDLKT